jgi:conjugal transfer pilin signal peptidase TrbI
MASVASSEARRWLLVRALPSLVLIVLALAYVEARYRIGIDAQVSKCLPPYALFLIDRWDRRAERGALYAFNAPGTMRPLFAAGQLVIKRAVGLPGDRVQVSPEHVRINGSRVGEGLALAERLGRTPGDFARVLRLPAGAWWMMGETADSFDSRYWGALAERRVIGRAYGLF